MWLHCMLAGLQLDLNPPLQPPNELKVSTLLILLMYFCYRMPRYIICICWLMSSTLRNYCVRHATNTLYSRLASQFSLHTMVSGSFTTLVLFLLFFWTQLINYGENSAELVENPQEPYFLPFTGYRSCLYTTLQGKVPVFKLYIGSLVRKQCYPKIGFQDTSNIL